LPMEKKRLRIDMKVDVKVIDEKKHLISMRMVPDPERYEKRTISDEEGYYDKYDNIFIPFEVFAKGVETLAGTPIYAPAPSIRDLKQYFAEASERVTKSLESELEWKPEEDRGAGFLERHVGSKLLFVVLYIDMVNSTRLSRVLSDIAYRSLLSTFMRETTLIVDAHGGYVHKYIGDGLIAFFPAENNYSGMTDSAVDCGLVMGLLMSQVLNPLLRKKAYPFIEFRIGIDSGGSTFVLRSLIWAFFSSLAPLDLRQLSQQ